MVKQCGVDDGVGVEPSALAGASKGGLGLKGMEERARQVGGKLSVVSAPGQGTRVRIEVPSAQGSAEKT